MKKRINIILGLSFSVLLFMIIWIYGLISHNVGEIKYDKSINKLTFKVCNEKRIFEYYSVSTSYQKGRKQMRKDLLNILNKENLKLENKTGYITFRFVINCKGESGWYRVNSTTEDYKEAVFKKTEINKLKGAILKLKNWKVGRLKNNKKVDSYYQINFKIKEGVIEDIF
ncbi:hypothetical protein [Tenacibaculum ovolyticum]|uniref:hypothetical protein n=1 Tax=Tenacibaculum ovolyticum TaxID=104270 RepID=UPI0012DD9390|nr:hypothetical protein [Tenacibaculum ovolyticum]